jgi:hypothetical protein
MSGDNCISVIAVQESAKEACGVQLTLRLDATSGLYYIPGSGARVVNTWAIYTANEV